MSCALNQGLKPNESIDHVRGGIPSEDARQPADELADLDLIGYDDAAVATFFVGVAARFTNEVSDVERDDRPSAGNGKVELFTIGCLKMLGLVCGERVESPPPEDPRNDRVNVGVEVDGKGQLASASREAFRASARGLDVTGRPSNCGLSILPDGAVDQRAVIMVEGQRVVDVGQCQIRPGFDHLFGC
jgi:hypothetical protein